MRASNWKKQTKWTGLPSQSPLNTDTSLLLVCTWRHGGHVGGQQQKHFSPLGTKLYFHVNSSRKYSFVLTPNMAALSRGCKKESSYILSQFNLLYTDTPLILALFIASSVSLLTGIDCTFFQLNHTLPATKPNFALRDRTSEMLLP